MSVSPAPTRYRAASMELAAYLDGKYVEMHIMTDDGEQLIIVCDKDSIFDIQRHIEQIGRDCPEILTWKKPVTPWTQDEITSANEIASRNWDAQEDV
ncbi:MAG: hypothetical protein HQL45_04335 [Alphaproteobacteria bacterium]|nr:hypothetical protein [Alphaproteobacteria bacterium]